MSCANVLSQVSASYLAKSADKDILLCILHVTVSFSVMVNCFAEEDLIHTETPIKGVERKKY